MTTLLKRVAYALTGIALCAVSLHAALPTFWLVSTETEFAKGEIDGLAIDSYGRLALGPTTSTVYDATAPFLWTMVEGPDGSVYVGTGNDGQVYRIDANGRGTVFFDSGELEVHALALAPGGGLFVGTSPDGKIYRVDAMGRSTVFFDPPDKYIWSLAVDSAGNVYAGTGDKGTVYKIAPNGIGTPFYQTKATHAMSLAFDRDGRLLVGTESPGRLFRVDGSGKPFVLLDSTYSEIHAIRVDAAGNIYAAALTARPGGGGAATPAPEPASTQTLTATVTTEVTAVVVGGDSVTVSGSSPSQTSTRPQGPSSGAIYKVLPDGASDMIWDSREDLPYDIALDADGSLVVATGAKGKIYRLTGDPLQATLIARVNAQQITTMLRDRGGRVLFTTSNPGRLVRLATAPGGTGTYLSEVRDAQTVATWGAMKWRAVQPTGTRVRIATRTGNTKTPDETWSDWSAPYSDPDGSAITSPRARYLQWRAVLDGARGESPLLTSVTAAYLPRNLRPRVTSVTINPPGTVFQKPFPTDPDIAGFEGDNPDRRFAAQTAGNNLPGSPNLGRRAYQRGLLTFVWRAEDDNRDELSYDVLYRREGETDWKPLKRDLSEAIYVWDTTSVPNGRYQVRVAASDAPSNSPATALAGSMDSATFDIDNTPPTVTVTGARREGARTVLLFDVRDQDSAVQKVEYSVDGDRWQAIYPKDGIADSRVEQFELPLDAATAARGVVIRAADTLNNVANARADVPASGGR